MCEFNIKHGVLDINSGYTIKTDSSSEERSMALGDLNTSERLYRIVTEEAYLKVAGDEKSNIAISYALGPWSERAMVLTVYPMDLKEKVPETQILYTDYSKETQMAYWKTVIGGLSVMNDMAKEESNGAGFTPFYGELVVPVVTTKDFNSSRSMVLPHGQFVPFVNETVLEQEMSIPHVLDEQEILKQQKYVSRHIDRIGKLMEFKIPERVSLQTRADAPFGYTFNFPIDGNEFDTEFVEKVQTTMEAHFMAYTNTIEDFYPRLAKRLGVDWNKIFPQPSFRMYCFLSDPGNGQKELQVTICPEFLSHAGMMEGAGVELHRNSDTPQRYSDTETQLFRMRFAKSLNGRLNGISELLPLAVVEVV